uniref:Uncharacterized protein n=1 Tax=Rhizophora mucronata TaxID=61149 RepID=A0A2P2INZ0_RHIMU
MVTFCKVEILISNMISFSFNSKVIALRFCNLL